MILMRFPDLVIHNMFSGCNNISDVIHCSPKNAVKGSVIKIKTMTHATFNHVYLDSRVLKRELEHWQHALRTLRSRWMTC